MDKIEKELSTMVGYIKYEDNCAVEGGPVHTSQRVVSPDELHTKSDVELPSILIDPEGH
jgi:hypothetical protein